MSATLVEQPKLLGDRFPQVLNHGAIAYTTEEAWEKQIGFLAEHRLAMHRRSDRAVIDLVHELPRELWVCDIDAALNHAVERPAIE